MVKRSSGVLVLGCLAQELVVVVLVVFVFFRERFFSCMGVIEFGADLPWSAISVCCYFVINKLIDLSTKDDNGHSYSDQRQESTVP